MNRNMGSDISIVIPSWNGLELLLETLPSVRSAARFYQEKTGSSTEILIVDDGGTDATGKVIPEKFPEIRLLRKRRNEGFAIACNFGFRHCSHPLISLLNNDVRVEESYFFYQSLHFQDSEVFAVTAKVFAWDRPLFTAGGRFGRFRRGSWSMYFNYDVSTAAGSWIEDRQLLSACAIGGFSAYSRKKLEELEGFNPLLSPFHWEDVDLSYRGWKRGWTIHYEPRSVAHHRISATIDKHFEKKEVKAAALRNRLLFHWINLHSPRYWVQHLLMLLVLLFTRVFFLDYRFYGSFLSSLKEWKRVRCQRKEERSRSKRSDIDVSRLLDSFYRSAPIQIYYGEQEVVEKHPDFQA